MRRLARFAFAIAIVWAVAQLFFPRSFEALPLFGNGLAFAVYGSLLLASHICYRTTLGIAVVGLLGVTHVFWTLLGLGVCHKIYWMLGLSFHVGPMGAAHVVTGSVLAVVLGLLTGRWVVAFAVVLAMAVSVVLSAMESHWSGLTATAGLNDFGIIAAPLHAGIAGSLFWSALTKAREQEHLKGRCEQCGYDLRGLSGGVCPECGQPIPPPLNLPPVDRL